MGLSGEYVLSTLIQRPNLVCTITSMYLCIKTYMVLGTRNMSAVPSAHWGDYGLNLNLSLNLEEDYDSAGKALLYAPSITVFMVCLVAVLVPPGISAHPGALLVNEITNKKL